MSILELLQNRNSTPAMSLSEPGPNSENLKEIIQAGLSAPDHGRLQPWQFILIQGQARTKLGELFASALQHRDPAASSSDLDRQRQKPLRAPTILVIVAKIRTDIGKIPPLEQILSAGCATLQIQLAATALGFGSVWLTGPNARDPMVKQALGINPTDEIVAFLNIGSIDPSTQNPQRPKTDEFLTEWQGNTSD